MSVYDAKFIPAEVTAAISPTCTTRTCRTLFVQMTAHSKRCLESTREVARLLGKGLAKA